MVILISGASHTGKTSLAQRLLEKYGYPYISIDHLKMGLIKSGNTSLTPLSDDAELTAYLWPIVREIAKTAIENKQNLVIEGCYIPYVLDFEDEYLREMSHYCLVMTEKYIKNHFDDIKKYASVIERRIDDSCCTMESVIADNNTVFAEAEKHSCPMIIIDDSYDVDITI